METIVYGFQITPGQDDELIFFDDLRTCISECQEHRAGIKRHDPALREDLGAMAVYRFALRPLSTADYLAVLNDEAHDLLRVAMTQMDLMALVAD